MNKVLTGVVFIIFFMWFCILSVVRATPNQTPNEKSADYYNNFVLKAKQTRLQIMRATYESSRKSRDVTKQLNDRIKNNRLDYEGSLNGIAGDPDRNMKKRLEIEYVYNGKIFQKTVYERRHIHLP